MVESTLTWHFGPVYRGTLWEYFVCLHSLCSLSSVVSWRNSRRLPRWSLSHSLLLPLLTMHSITPSYSPLPPHTLSHIAPHKKTKREIVKENMRGCRKNRVTFLSHQRPVDAALLVVGSLMSKSARKIPSEKKLLRTCKCVHVCTCTCTVKEDSWMYMCDMCIHELNILSPHFPPFLLPPLLLLSTTGPN